MYVGKFIFDNVEVNGGLYTKFVNGLDMHYMIPLRSEQQISEPLHFGKVYSDRNISVGNFVNRVKLETEFENTLMVYDFLIAYSKMYSFQLFVAE